MKKIKTYVSIFFAKERWVVTVNYEFATFLSPF